MMEGKNFHDFFISKRRRKVQRGSLRNLTDKRKNLKFDPVQSNLFPFRQRFLPLQMDQQIVAKRKIRIIIEVSKVFDHFQWHISSFLKGPTRPTTSS